MKKAKHAKSNTASDHARQAEQMVRKLATEYGIRDAGGRAILAQIKSARIRQLQAEEHINANGAVIEDRFGQPRPNPSCAIERAARHQILSALRLLNLDLEPLRDAPGRPPMED